MKIDVRVHLNEHLKIDTFVYLDTSLILLIYVLIFSRKRNVLSRVYLVLYIVYYRMN